MQPLGQKLIGYEMQMYTFIFFVTALAGAALTHYLGFMCKEEFMFLGRKQAQGLFFIFFILIAILGYNLWKENEVSRIFWQWINL